MYIQFDLNTDIFGLSNGHALLLIRRELIEWSIKYNISYKEKTVKNTYRVIFNNLETYTFFGLTWDPTYPFCKHYRLIEPMNPPKSVD
jgi:hypothetical protein